MKMKGCRKGVSMLLAASMLLGMPMTALAENGGTGQTELSEETPVEETLEISDYAGFLVALKVLEGYAADYAAANPTEDAKALVINYIRTGVERYTSGTWQTMAGAENTGFTDYVKQKDSENGTEASALKNLNELALPNGNVVDLGHMFGTIDITNYARVQKMTENVIQARADLGGWAGDIADMMFCAENVDVSDKVDTTETDVDVLSDAIRTRYLGADYGTLNHVDHSFSSTDLYGDLDAFYVCSELQNGTKSISEILESYFTATLTEKDRAAYFLDNRLNHAQKKADIRNAVLNIYTSNELLKALEASYSLSDLANHDLLQKVCCYAFADYLYELAGNEDGGSTDPDQPDVPDEPENAYYSVFSSKTTSVAPGVTQNIKYAMTKDDKQLVYYTATMDVARDDVNVYANYHDNDPSSWAMARVTDQMAAAQKKHSNPEDTENYIENYNAVLGINADFYNMSTGAPMGVLVMNGKVYHGMGGENFFAILKDGTPLIGGTAEWEANKDNIQEAVGGRFYLVKDGKSAVNSDANYYKNRVTRTAVGITKEGKVVFVVVDGRQEPFSAGGSTQEVAQIMLEAGCVTAINLDGGGSSTFAARQEGSDQVTVVNRPSDGYERSVSSSLMVVSTAKISKEFHHALLQTDADYLTVGSSLQVTANGVSESGNAAALPKNTTWSVADNSVGNINENGVFTAEKTGDAEIQLLAEGQVIGSKILHVVVPDKLLFTKKNMDVIYGQKAELPLAASYNGNEVAITPADIKFELSNAAAGTMEDFEFIGNADSGLRNVKVTAMLASDYSVSATMTLALYNETEAKFDFDTAMRGDRKLAWNREVSNSEKVSVTKEDVTTDTYYIQKADQPMVTDYTFALDMQKIEVPEALVPLLQMVAGGDLENVTAWDILLQLAERVSSKTIVHVQIQFDKNVDVDYSQLKVVNDYFEVTNAKMDEEANILNVDISWKKQTEAIPAETANPIVIVSGISLTPKADAAWDDQNCLTIKNSGTIGYDIYLGANALYSMACQESFQKNYGIYPYTEPENTAHPAGGHFASTFRSFEDSYVLDKTMKDGWTEWNGQIYYFKDNQPMKGIQKLPGYQDEQNSYYYDLGEDGVYKGKLTGLFEQNGGKYYAVKGLLKNGWRVITNEAGQDEYYYFDYKNSRAVDGKQSVGGHTYVFENYVLVKGAWEKDEKGIHYFWAGKEKQNEWFTADGKQYFAYANTCAVALGLAKTLNHERTGEAWYLFDEETGALRTDYTGLYETGGKTYYIVEGVRTPYPGYPGLIRIGGDYCYITSSYELIKGRKYYVSKTNGLLPTAEYEFDADGKLVMKDPSEIKNGIVKETEEHWYYYVQDKKFYAGLIEIDGAFYYVRSNFEVVHGRSYYVSKTNGLKPAGTYEFDADGKMIIKEPAQMKNGIVKETDDLWYYYVNDKKFYAGLIEIDGAYYYVRSNFEVVHGRSYYVSKTNGLKPAGTYEFDADGKMVIKEPEPEKPNGIVKGEDGVWHYYKDGVKYYAGLIEIDGSYYYVNSNCEVIHGRNYFISKTNGLKKQDTYEFDADGKLVEKDVALNGIVKDGDVWYYYVDGIKTYAGLIEIDGSYYYVKTNCEVVHGKKYFISKTNGLMANGSYTFDDDGKMVIE